MFYILSGFIFGFLIPFIARKFGKFMPATPAYAIYRILKPAKTVSREKKISNRIYQKLVRKYFMRSIGWAIFCAALTFLCHLGFEKSGNITNWYIGCLWILLLLAEIDKRMELLPDILTVPLLIMGFLVASINTIGSFVDPQASAIGATAGYVLPVIASGFLVWKDQNALGGGDIKLFAALGAWLGIENLLYVIIFACGFFVVEAFITKKYAGAFGPSIVWAAIFVAFLIITGIF